MKRGWFSRHPICFMALYSVLYLTAFNFLETRISMPEILVHCRLDDLIPFCKYAVVPYFAWFLWIPFTLFFLLWKAPREDFWRLCLPLFAGMTIALACYVILPTGLALRPYYVPGNDIFARVVRFLYRADTATNVCPSIHVLNSVTLLLAYYRCPIFTQPGRRWMRPAAAVLCLSIVCSTVLLKQHSCIDVVLGALLALVLDSMFTRAAVKAMGLELLAPDDFAWGITSVLLPEGVDGNEVLRLAAEKHGIYMAGGQDQLKGRIVRIGHMGWVDWADVAAGLYALERSIVDAGGYIGARNYLEQGLAVYRAALEVTPGTPVSCPAVR